MKNKQQYPYPLDISWSTEEIASVLSFLNHVEQAYESTVEAEKLLASYRAFKQVVPSKSKEKKIGREFEVVSGYSLYKAVQVAVKKERGRISLGN